jgi:hypothetical protein
VKIKESEVSFFWDITRRVLEDYNLEQNRCEELQPDEAAERCVGVRILCS